jgi:glycosyltransferase involved in cell wall biosynthesis
MTLSSAGNSAGGYEAPPLDAPAAVGESVRPGVLLVKGNYGLAGGPETLIASIAQHLDRRRFRPALVVLQRDGVAEAPQLNGDRLGIARKNVRWSGLVGAPTTAARLHGIAASHRAALVHTHDMRANLVAWLLRARSGLPWIAHVHGWLGNTQTGKWRLYERVDRRLVRRADLVLVGSIAAKHEVEEAGARRVAVLPNAIEIVRDGSWTSGGAAVRARLGIPDSAAVVGILGRVHPGKGHRFLLHAIARLRAEGLDIRGLVVGDGPDLGHLHTLVCELHIAGDVHFAGYCEDPIAYLAAMDVFVVPSLKESLPLTMLEAMALRRTVIATTVGDIPDVIVDGNNGLLVPPGDAEAIAAALRTVVSGPDRRAAIGDRARKIVEERFSAETMSRRLQDFYLSVLGQKARAE